LPANLITGAFSLGLSERIILRFGIRAPLAIGMLLVATSLALFARAPVEGTYVADVLPGMLLLGLGMGISLNPVLLAAMSEVQPSEAGLASGVVNASGQKVRLAGLNWYGAEGPDVVVGGLDYRRYEDEKRRRGLVDFDDLLVRTVNLLELFEDVRDRYRKAFRWILVDEYQDTNRVQYRFLQLLASEHQNLTVVGDEDVLGRHAGETAYVRGRSESRIAAQSRLCRRSDTV